MPDPLLLTAEEAARVLAIGRSKLYEMIAAGEIASISIGKCRRIPADELRAWVQRQREAQTQRVTDAEGEHCGQR